MKLLKHYIGFAILKMTLLILLIMAGLEFFVTFIGEFHDIGQGNYHLWQAISYVTLSLPANIYNLFPIAGLIGSLLGLGNLASHSELIVMQTAGISISNIIKASLRIAIFMWIGMFIVGEIVGPPALHLANTNKKIAQSAGQTLKNAGGFWLRDHNQYVYIDKILPGNRLQNINVYQFNRVHQLTQMSFAKEGLYQHHAWWLHDISQTLFQNNTATSRVFKEKKWAIKLHAELFKMSHISANELTLPKLYQLIHYRKMNGLRVSSQLLNFWQRIFLPFATLVMIFLAVPFIFGPLRNVTIGLRIIVGISVGFAFYLVNQFFGPFSLVYQLPTILGASLPIILFLVIGLLLLRRVK